MSGGSALKSAKIRVGSSRGCFVSRNLERMGLSRGTRNAISAITHKRGTLRGMHFQRPPKPEVKVVRCLIGAVYDVLLDLRPDSSMYLKHEVFELTAENGDALYVPEGIAHGFQTLTDGVQMFYQMSEFYTPALNDGVRWNDPAFGLELADRRPIDLRQRQSVRGLQRESLGRPVMKRLLFTGAGGFIGRHAIPHLLRRDYEVHAVDVRPLELEGCHVHTANLLEPAEVQRVVETIRPTHLLHMAWYVEHGKFWTSEENTRWVEASLGLFREFITKGGKRLVTTGTCAEYETGHALCVEDETPCRPETLYGACKYARIRDASGALPAIRREPGLAEDLFPLWSERARAKACAGGDCILAKRRAGLDVAWRTSARLPACGRCRARDRVSVG